MRGKDLLYMLSEIDSDLIEQAESVAPTPKASRTKYISIAVCAVAVAAVLGFAFLRDVPAHSGIGVSTDVNTPITSQTVFGEDTAPTPDVLPDDTDPDDSIDPDIDGYDPATGGAFSYKELTEGMYSFGEAYGLVRLEIIKTFTPEEAAETTGNPVFAESPELRTLYQARITHDYLNDRDMSLEIMLCLFSKVHGETPAKEHIAVLSYTTSPGYYIPDMLFDIYDIDGVDIAFQRGNKWISLASDLVENDYPDLDLAMTAEEAELYTHKMTVADLAGFIREDWAMRGIDFKGFDIPDTDNSEIRRQRFLYHDVKLTEYRPSFAAEADFLGNYDLADVSEELFKDKPGLRLIEFEVKDILSDDKAAEVSGRSDGTLYTLQILKDYTADSDEAAIESSDIALWHYGNGHEQYKGYPVWAEGERFIAAVYDSGRGYYLPVYELEFALMKSPIDGEIYAYDIAEGPVYFDSPGLPRGVAEIEYRWDSTTDNNQRLAGGRFKPEELASAIAEIIKKN